MRKQDQLVHLIKSLTPAEKKFFKEYTVKNKTGQGYMRLYEELQKADTYEVDKLCKKLGKTKANLAHEKDYLQEVLFKVLRDCHSEVSDIKLSNKINNIFILNQRGCYDMAYDLIHKTIKECLQTSEFIGLIKLYNVLLNVHWYMTAHSPQKYKEQRELFTGMEAAIQGMADISAFGRTNLRMSELWNKSSGSPQPEVIAEAKEILNSDLLTRDFPHPIFSQMQAGISGTMYYLIGEKEKSLQYKMKDLEIIEKYPLETNIDEQSYVVAVENVFNHMIRANFLKEAEAFLNKIHTRYYHKLPLNKAYLDKTFDASYHKHLMVLYMKQYKNGGRDKRDIQDVLKKFEKNIPHIQSGVIALGHVNSYVVAAKLAFLIEDYDTALRWFNVVADYNEKNSLDAQTTSRIALAIVHYQFGSYTVSKSLAASAAIFIKKIRPIFKSERAILRLLSNIWRKLNTKERKEAFRQLKQELDTLKQIPAEKAIQELFYYDDWIERNLK